MIAEQRETQIRAEEKATRINLVIDFITFIPVTLVAILSNSVLLLTDIFDNIKSLLVTFISWKITKRLIKGYCRKYFRLYTSTDPIEAQANHLYDRLGFKIYYTEKTKDDEHTLLYRQAIISEVDF